MRRLASFYECFMSTFINYLPKIEIVIEIHPCPFASGISRSISGATIRDSLFSTFTSMVSSSAAICPCFSCHSLLVVVVFPFNVLVFREWWMLSPPHLPHPVQPSTATEWSCFLFAVLVLRPRIPIGFSTLTGIPFHVNFSSGLQRLLRCDHQTIFSWHLFAERGVRV